MLWQVNTSPLGCEGEIWHNVTLQLHHWNFTMNMNEQVSINLTWQSIQSLPKVSTTHPYTYSKHSRCFIFWMSSLETLEMSFFACVVYVHFLTLCQRRDASGNECIFGLISFAEGYIDLFPIQDNSTGNYLSICVINSMHIWTN